MNWGTILASALGTIIGIVLMIVFCGLLDWWFDAHDTNRSD